LPLTGWRLGAGGGNLHYLFNPHVTPRLRQTARCALAFYREICPYHYFVGLYSIVGTMLNSTLCRFVVHCRYVIQFHYFFGFYFIVGTVLNFTALSVCTPFSARDTLSTTLSPACAQRNYCINNLILCGYPDEIIFHTLCYKSV